MSWTVTIASALITILLIILLIVGIRKRSAAYRREAEKRSAYEERWSKWGDWTRIGP